MKKHLFLLMLSTAILAGCSKNEGEEGERFAPPAQEQLKQSAYADNESTGDGFSFTADAPWTATVNELKTSAKTLASYEPTTTGGGNNVTWLRLYNGDKETYKGEAGTVTLRIEIDQNYTGERREATITIRSGNNTFTVTVVQEGTKQDGSENEVPVKVTKITLDKTELSLHVGDKATLTATIEPSDATVKSVIWSSSVPTVVSVNPETGEITAISDGTATVTATSYSNKEVSASCGITVGENEPIAPVNRLLISEMEFRYENDTDKSHIKMTYDDKNRMIKWEEESSGPGYQNNRTITFIYGNSTVQITSSETDKTKTYTAYLNEAGLVTRTEGSGIDATTYEYDSENRLIRMTTQANERQEYVWKNGNIVQIKYTDNDQGVTHLSDYTYYENLANKENFDLFFDRISWDCEVVIAGLTGIQCRNLLHEERNESEWGYKDDFDMEYEVDEDGYITKAIQKRPQSDDPWLGEIKHISGR